MSAYNGESTPARLLVPHYRRAEEEGRALLRETVRTSGSLEVVGAHLQGRLNLLSAPRRPRARPVLCDQLNQTKIRYPGTDLMLRYSGALPPPVA